jgi:transposase
MIDKNIHNKLDRIEGLLASLINAKQEKDYYSTSEVAEMLDKAEFTVREWCRLGRIWAEKRQSGRGAAKEWMISRQEINRIRNEGLLPMN